MKSRMGSAIALTWVLAGAWGQAQASQPVAGDNSNRVVLSGNVHRALRDLMPESRCDAATPMEHMILAFRMRPEAKARLEHLLAEQHNPYSPRWHQWLSPEQFATAFGPSQEEIAKTTGWLRSQGFRIDEVARGGMSITFSGDVGAVEQAFRTPIMRYQVEGRACQANATDPSIPSELGDFVEGVVSLHNLPRRSKNTGLRKLPLSEAWGLRGVDPMATTSSNTTHYMAPGDFATIYNVNPLYQDGTNGAGVTIAVVGRTNPPDATTKWAYFRNLMGLSTNTPTIVLNGADPGDQGIDEDVEADLDAEWAGAVAPGATIKFVCSASTATSDGADLSAKYIVDNALAPILTTSFGLCESDLGSTENGWLNNLWLQAVGEGITVFVASGDSGASACSPATATSGISRAVDGVASTPYDVAVGGTMFNEGSGDYWLSYASMSSTYVSALRYIPEVAWNENSSRGLAATGGGASTLYAKPSWQVAVGAAAGGYRQVPDVSLSAGGHDGYLVISEGDIASGTFSVLGGTSCGAPSFAGLMALVEQRNGQFQGNANTTFYPLANAQYLGGVTVFHDITAGNNNVPGVTGYSAGTGYDMCTGLGSVDADALVTHWSDTLGVAIGVPAGSVGLLTSAAGGTPHTFTATVTGTPDNPVAWSTTGGALVPTGPASASFSATVPKIYTITARAAVDPSKAATISVNAHGADFMEPGPPTGLDVLDLVGHNGATDHPELDLDGNGTVDQADWTIILKLLGWVN